MISLYFFRHKPFLCTIRRVLIITSLSVIMVVISQHLFPDTDTGVAGVFVLHAITLEELKFLPVKSDTQPEWENGIHSVAANQDHTMIFFGTNHSMNSTN
jgi:hypothetical protein